MVELLQDCFDYYWEQYGWDYTFVAGHLGIHLYPPPITYEGSTPSDPVGAAFALDALDRVRNKALTLFLDYIDIWVTELGFLKTQSPALISDPTTVFMNEMVPALMRCGPVRESVHAGHIYPPAGVDKWFWFSTNYDGSGFIGSLANLNGTLNTLGTNYRDTWASGNVPGGRVLLMTNTLPES